MNSDVESAIQNLASSGWRIIKNDAGDSLPTQITERYPWIPKEVSDVLFNLREAVSPDETVWLLGGPDYSGTSDSSFAWNEWEQMSIEAADGDQEWIARITAFWNEHFPVAHSVGDGYAYFALTPNGSVVTGREPEFEEPSPFAPGFTEFLLNLASV
ncbi:MAG TPA: hypothetical protein VG796_25765 [Verrucomicrobiales bacterium]|jgi:hypothetical protein|nr:hypothetical protein [Verrucomicrobiales bacterium]